MKIKCPYCESMFDDTLTNCPNCGAASEGVVRTEKKQPLTIEQLQQWYADRGLPPYKTTRFFIGEDYRGARAFGIYRDESTGNFVVYKNLSNGQRKVRYEGTDEAYAVNELYMRLKEEIIQQKRNAVSKGRGTAGKSSGASGKKSGGLKKFVKDHLLAIIIASVCLIAGSIWVAKVRTIPDTGYYNYNDTIYYHADLEADTDDWYYFDTDANTWEPTYDALPEELVADSTAKDFYYTSTWDYTTQEGDFDVVTPFEWSDYYDQYDPNTGDPNYQASDTDDDDDDDFWDNDDDDDDYSWDTNDTWDTGTTDWDDDW